MVLSREEGARAVSFANVIQRRRIPCKNPAGSARGAQGAHRDPWGRRGSPARREPRGKESRARCRWPLAGAGSAGEQTGDWRGQRPRQNPVIKNDHSSRYSENYCRGKRHELGSSCKYLLHEGLDISVWLTENDRFYIRSLQSSTLVKITIFTKQDEQIRS